MKGGKKGARNLQPDVPIVYDPCGIDVNDPVGNHLVNFTFEVTANDDSEKPFEGDIDFVLPYNLPKNTKPPKIELSHPTTEWKTTMQTLIDDNFLNQVHEKRFMYRIVFLYKATSHGKQQARAAPKKGADKAVQVVTNHTFFVDATCLLVRGGRFKPFLSYSASCQPPGFENFTFKVSVDFPILSDAQIRRIQPFVVFLKGVHQLPSTPISFEDLDKTCAGSFITVKADQTTYTTYPQKHGPEMKLNIALVFWNRQASNLTIELRDREVNPPENLPYIGSCFVLPQNQTKKEVVVQPLSIEQILGIKNDTTARPYGESTFPLEAGRKLLPFKPVPVKDCLIQPGFYIENGTYITVEMESMKDHVPVLQTPAPPLTPTGQKKGAQNAANDKNHAAKQQQPVQEAPPYYFNRCILLFKNMDKITPLDQSRINMIMEKIVLTNSAAFNVKDLAAVPSMKIQKDESEAISGFYIMLGNTHIMVIEVLDKSEASQQLDELLQSIQEGGPGLLNGEVSTDTDESPKQKSEDILIISDFSKQFKSPRLYGTFDCAVKKFKLGESLENLLEDPSIYVQNSHMSNCFTVLNQLYKLYSLTSRSMIGEVEKFSWWPNSQDLEMLNAKKGVLLSMEELSFPQKQPKTTASTTRRDDDNQHDEDSQQILILNQNTQSENLTYNPISNEVVGTRPHDVNYFIQRNMNDIAELQKKHAHKRGLVMTTEDGEIEYWDTRKGNPNEKSESGHDWSVEKPEKYESLANEVSSEVFSKNLRPDQGADKNGVRFYSYKTQKTFLPSIEKLKANVNNEPWSGTDMSLATADSRWINNSRGPIYTDYVTTIRPRDNMNNYKPLSIEEEYKEQILPGQNNRTYETSSKKHLTRFNAVLPQFTKDKNMILGQPNPTPLTVQEEYHDPQALLTNIQDIRQGPNRFRTVFPEIPIKKGSTDSVTVKKITFTFPPEQPGF